jgi:hypothetical protein
VLLGVAKGVAVCVEGRPVLNPYIRKTGEPAVSVTIFAKWIALGCHDKKFVESGMPPVEAFEPEGGQTWDGMTDFDDYGSDEEIPF